MASITVLFILPSLFKRCKNITALLLPFIGSIDIWVLTKLCNSVEAISGVGLAFKLENVDTVSSNSWANLTFYNQVFVLNFLY